MIDTCMLSGCELIDTENISLPSQNMKFVGELLVKERVPYSGSAGWYFSVDKFCYKRLGEG